MKVIDINEVAEMLSVPVSTLRYWRRTGEGPQAVKLGKYVRYIEQDVIDYIESQRVPTSSN